MSFRHSPENTLSKRTSLGVGGEALRLHVPQSIAEFASLLKGFNDAGEFPFILGGGCNTLFPSQSFNRPVIHTVELNSIEVAGTRMRAQAGVRLETLMRTAIRNGLQGLEMFGGIPGTVGGAVAMNAGGSGFDFGQRISHLTVIDPQTGKPSNLDGRDVEWKYRSCELNGLIVAEAEFALKKEDPVLLQKKSVEFIRKKAENQPLAYLSAGCVFKNPPGKAAAKLIDDAGLKGMRVGSALVSPVHANFIVNADGAARSEDVLELIEKVREKVFEAFSVKLELEIVLAEESESEVVSSGAC